MSRRVSLDSRAEQEAEEVRSIDRDEQGHLSHSECETERAKDTGTKTRKGAYDTLCFSGGGTNGIAFIGTLRALFRYGEVDWTAEDRVINHFIGTSVGALVATLLYCRIDIFTAEIAALVTDFCSFVSQTPTALLKSGFGLSDGDHCIQFLRRALKKQFNKENLTFVELRHIVGGTLTLVASDLKTAEPVYISFETHPHEEVAKACFASMCLPGMFKWQTLTRRVCTEWLPDAVVTRCVSAAQFKKAKSLDDFIGERFVLDGTEREILAYDNEAGNWHVACDQAQNVLDGCFTDNNPFSAAKPGANVLNLVVKRSRCFEPMKHGIGKYAMRVLSLSMRRVEKLMEHIHGAVQRDCIAVDAKKANVRNSIRVSRADFAKLVCQGEISAEEFLVQKYGPHYVQKTRPKKRHTTREKHAEKHAAKRREPREVQTQTDAGCEDAPRVLKVGKWHTQEKHTQEEDTHEKEEEDEFVELGPDRYPVRMKDLNQEWTKMSSSGKAVMRAWTTLDPRFDQWRDQDDEDVEEEQEEEEEEEVDEFIDTFQKDQ